MCQILFIKLWFKSDWYFIILLSQDGFKCDPETISKQSLYKVSSEATVGSYSSK